MADSDRDLIDLLIDRLNDGVSGVIFDRDVIDTDRPDSWGAVELVDCDEEWADGKCIDQVNTCDLWVCVSDRGSGIKREVQAVLDAFGAQYELGWRFVSRNWHYNLEKVVWRWSVTLWGPLELDDGDPEETEGDAEPEEAGETEETEDPEASEDGNS